ncbi:hypothetical protein JKP88DRAFT_351133 [Tribonema minus]|uniref:Uncharacterized protein n=1 Tax=Tribonema minus TaxID=303371 RepID=A0A836C9G9_9STRA|nr:hypothetical protein JKP88DRAFT_351133 [Tribonema minus]
MGFMRWLRGFYNALFWYGAAFDDDDSLPAMDFKDLMEQYETEGDRRRARQRKGAAEAPLSGGRRAAGDRQVEYRVPPTEYQNDSDWKFRWNPGGDRDRAPKRTSTQPDRRAPPARRAGGSAAAAPPARRRARQQDSERDSEEELRRAALRRRARDLTAKRAALRRDLAKVDERLSVLDTTLELWLRRGRALAARRRPPGGADAAELVSAKRRVYKLRDDGRALEAARVELAGRLENASANLARVLGSWGSPSGGGAGVGEGDGGDDAAAVEVEVVEGGDAQEESSSGSDDALQEEQVEFVVPVVEVTAEAVDAAMSTPAQQLDNAS